MAKFENLPGPRGLQLGQPSELSTARRKLWCDVWVAMAGNNLSNHLATKWADAAVKAFDERFGPMVLVEQEEKAPA